MARAAVGLSTQRLAELAEVRPATVNHFEQGRDAYRSTIDKLQRALEAQGVIFIAAGELSPGGGPGVRLKG